MYNNICYILYCATINKHCINRQADAHIYLQIQDSQSWKRMYHQTFIVISGGDSMNNIISCNKK